MFTVCIFTMCVALSLAKRCVALCEFVTLVFGQTPFVCDRTAERETKTCCENGSNDCEHVDLRFSHKNYSEFCRFSRVFILRNATGKKCSEWTNKGQTSNHKNWLEISITSASSALGIEHGHQLIVLWCCRDSFAFVFYLLCKFVPFVRVVAQEPFAGIKELVCVHCRRDTEAGCMPFASSACIIFLWFINNEWKQNQRIQSTRRRVFMADARLVATATIVIRLRDARGLCPWVACVAHSSKRENRNTSTVWWNRYTENAVPGWCRLLRLLFAWFGTRCLRERLCDRTAPVCEYVFSTLNFDCNYKEKKINGTFAVDTTLIRRWTVTAIRP